MKTILNYGGGVNSTALVIEIVNRKMPLDYVIFADTGSEMPETYEYIEVMKDWFKKKNIQFVIVKNKYNQKLYDYYFDKKTIPYRLFRDCTDKFKKQPILKFIKEFKKEGVNQYIGIAIDEARRMRKSDTKWIEFVYPLCDWGVNREGCIEIIRKEGLPIPIKSGCYLCPFQPQKSWVSLLKNHKDLFKKARLMEEQNLSYPKNTLTWQHNLAMLERSIKEQTKLAIDGQGYVCQGWCMT